MNIHIKGRKLVALLVSIIIFSQLCIAPVCSQTAKETVKTKTGITAKNKAPLKAKSKVTKKTAVKKKTVKKLTVKSKKKIKKPVKKKIKKKTKAKAKAKTKIAAKKIIKPGTAANQPTLPIIVSVPPAAASVKPQTQPATTPNISTPSAGASTGGGGGGGSSDGVKPKYKTFTDPITGFSVDYPASWMVKQEENQHAWATRFYYPNEAKTEAALVAMVAKAAVDPNIDLHADKTIEKLISDQKSMVGTFEVSETQKTSMLGGKAIIIKALSVDSDQTSTAWQQIWFVFQQHLCSVTLITAADKLSAYSEYFDSFVKSFQSISTDINDDSGIVFTTYQNNDLGIVMQVPQSWNKSGSEEFDAVRAEFVPPNGDQAMVSVCKDSEFYEKVSQAKNLEEGFDIMTASASTEMTDLFICDRKNLTVNGVKMFEATKIYYENGKQYKEIERIALANETLYDCRAKADIGSFDKYRSTFVKCLNSLAIK